MFLGSKPIMSFPLSKALNLGKRTFNFFRIMHDLHTIADQYEVFTKNEHLINHRVLRLACPSAPLIMFLDEVNDP